MLKLVVPVRPREDIREDISHDELVARWQDGKTRTRGSLAPNSKQPLGYQECPPK